MKGSATALPFALRHGAVLLPIPAREREPP